MSPSPLLTLLRLAPLITSTASLTYAHDTNLFFRIFLSPTYSPPEANLILPPWFKTYMKRGVVPIITLYPLSLISAGANIYFTEASRAGAAAMWYGLGFGFTVGHFLFARWAVRLLVAVAGDESKGKCTEDLREWLGMHLWRSLSVDGPGWVCFLMAAVVSL
ncbi:hypothetical protein ACLMJK_009154 [Lecanora helva]